MQERQLIFTRIYSAQRFSQKLIRTQALTKRKMVVGGTPFRVLDENAEIGLVAPSEGVLGSVGVNFFVDDINEQIKIAEDTGLRHSFTSYRISRAKCH